MPNCKSWVKSKKSPKSAPAGGWKNPKYLGLPEKTSMRSSDNVDMRRILDNLKKETSHRTQGHCPQAPRRNLGRIRAIIATDGMGRQWSQALQESRVPPRHSICTGYGNSVGNNPQRVPLVQDMLEPFQKVARPRRFPRGLAHTGRTIRISPRNQLGPDMPRRVKIPIKKKGEETGPSPVDRGKSVTNPDTIGTWRWMAAACPWGR